MKQRDKALDAMRSYQEQCDSLRGEMMSQMKQLEEQRDQVTIQ